MKTLTEQTMDWEKRFEKFFNCDIIFRSEIAMDHVKKFIFEQIQKARQDEREKVLREVEEYKQQYPIATVDEVIALMKSISIIKNL